MDFVTIATLPEYAEGIEHRLIEMDYSKRVQAVATIFTINHSKWDRDSNEVIEHIEDYLLDIPPRDFAMSVFRFPYSKSPDNFLYKTVGNIKRFNIPSTPNQQGTYVPP